MLEHPGIELQVLIKEKGLTQKAFSSILGKKVSEVNELLKGKRNITIQRDYLLHQTLGTPMKYWILKQIDYDYSLLDIEETSTSPLDKEWIEETGRHSEQSEESISANTPFGTQGKIQENTKQINSSANEGTPEGQTESQETPAQEQENEDDEDFKKRARIFKTF